VEADENKHPLRCIKNNTSKLIWQEGERCNQADEALPGKHNRKILKIEKASEGGKNSIF